MTDVRGVAIDHDLIERTTFVIGKDHKIIATLSSKDDGLSPDAARGEVIGDRAAAFGQITAILLLHPHTLRVK